MTRHNQLIAVTAAALMLLTGACTSSAPAAPGGASAIAIVAGENQYGDVAAQIGGQFVTVYSVDSNPNTDPHTYEVTAGVARRVAAAQVLIENGLGYDDFMRKLASASS